MVLISFPDTENTPKTVTASSAAAAVYAVGAVFTVSTVKAVDAVPAVYKSSWILKSLFIAVTDLAPLIVVEIFPVFIGFN